MRSTDALAAVAAAPAEASAMAADAAALADVDIPAIPRPTTRPCWTARRSAAGRQGRQAERRATAKAGARPNGHRRAARRWCRSRRSPEDEADRDFDGFRDEAEAEESVSGVLPMQMVGDGPLVVREKFHASRPMTIDDALLEMELVGHDFFAYHDSQCGKFSVIYRRRGYDYGVIRLVENERGLLTSTCKVGRGRRAPFAGRPPRCRHQAMGC